MKVDLANDPQRWCPRYSSTATRRSIIAEEKWVRGDVHTNTVESVWSLLKRGVVGTYHQISMKHLDACLDELEHRFNNRDNQFLFRDTLLKLVNAEKLPYAELTKAAA